MIIDQFRLRGPSGGSDEFISLYNEAATPLTVAASDASSGYGVAASDGILRCAIPNGTVIPAHGHFLCANSIAYSLASYPAGNGTTATADATYTTDIPDNAGIAVFTTTNPVNFALGTRLDAVGSTSEANTLYKEGTGYLALIPFSIDYQFVRDTCGKSGSITNFVTCTAAGLPVDSNNNANDFYFVDTNGTSAGAGQRLGAPAPQNLSSPVFGSAAISSDLLDNCSSLTAAPNVDRVFTSDPANNSTFGTLDIRRTYTNSTGAPITRLRFRIMDLTTFPAPSGYADLRPRTSSSVVVSVDRSPCAAGTSNITVQGTTLEQQPNQPNGGGFNSSMSAGTVTLGTPLADGDSIDLRFLMGIQQTGKYKLGLVTEALPDGGSIFEINGCTDGCPPAVVSSVRAGVNPASAGTVQYTVTFDQIVTGVNSSDFTLTTTGPLAGATIASVTGSGTTYTVTVNTGSGTGTVRLDLTDNDSIINAAALKLGGNGNGNGNFITGEVYTITTPAVVSSVRAGVNPASAGTVQYTVTFDQIVTGVDSSDFTLTTTGTVAGATIASVTGNGTAYSVTVNTGTGTGTVRLDLTDNDSIINAATQKLGGAGNGNGNFITGEVYTITAPAPVPTPTPTPAPATPSVPCVSATGAFPGLTVLPCLLNFNNGDGANLATAINSTLMSTLHLSNAVILSQNSSGVIVVQFDGGRLAFVPLGIQSDIRSNGVYASTNGRYTVVTAGTGVTVVPGVVNLQELLSLLPGVTVVADKHGILSGTINDVTYVVQPSYSVQTVASGKPLLMMGSDGKLRFTDSAGNSQLLNPAFLEPDTVDNILLSIDGAASSSVQLDGSIVMRLLGQSFEAVPDLTLETVPSAHAGDRWWQEGPNRYRFRNLNQSSTSQGLTLR